MEILLLAAPIVIAGYVYSLRRRSKQDCRVCHGRGRSHSGTFRGAYGNCWACHGRGYHIRWGVLLFMRNRAKAIKSGQHGRNF